jgi:hypothetical protein
MSDRSERRSQHFQGVPTDFSTGENLKFELKIQSAQIIHSPAMGSADSLMLLLSGVPTGITEMPYQGKDCPSRVQQSSSVKVWVRVHSIQKETTVNVSAVSHAYHELLLSRFSCSPER